ncbi:MAG: hypothetical protein JST94_11925 [Bacteroidetes bacterium]|nr:hypothetical protein [Bacteroidota bacterium]MBS1672134.1 hypothetical protein [Bacteroidota bacterium]
MKLKLNNTQLLMFSNLLFKSINEYNRMKENKALDVQGFVYKSILEILWVKTQKKMFLMQKRYNIKIEPSEALVLFDEYSGEFEDDLYTRAFMQPFCDNVHKTILCSTF